MFVSLEVGGRWPRWVISVYCCNLLPTWHKPAVSVVHSFPSHLGWLASLHPLIWSERGQSRLPVLKVRWEVNSLAQTVFNLCQLDEVSHLALYLCVPLAVYSLDLLAAGALSWGLMERDLQGTEGRCLCLSGWLCHRLSCLSSCWPSVGSCCWAPSRAPQMEEGKISSLCISCQGYVVD